MKNAGDLSIAESIRQGLARLTPTERKPAMALLANYPVPGLETVAQFARRAGVSGPTILRLVAKLGFASYPAVPAGTCATNWSCACSRRSPRFRNAARAGPSPIF